jgi:hypothetical protein
MREAVPTFYRWVQADGEILGVVALRLVFGGSFSPVVSEATISELFGIPDTVFEKRERVWREDFCYRIGCLGFILMIYWNPERGQRRGLTERWRL